MECVLLAPSSKQTTLTMPVNMQHAFESLFQNNDLENKFTPSGKTDKLLLMHLCSNKTMTDSEAAN